MNEASLSELIGKVVRSITVAAKVCESRASYIAMALETGEEYTMYHNQSCCEDVYIEDMVGDVADMIGSPLLTAEMVQSKDERVDSDASRDPSWTWTFYKFSTVKGYVTFRWYGTSNGYYSEEVEFWRTK